MPSALITIDQAANPQPTGVAGRARDDIILGSPVTLRNADDTDVNRWRWALRDKPIGSTVVIATLSATQITFTPDIDGTYRFTLSVNDGAPSGEVDTRLVCIRDGFGRLYPAAAQEAEEANYLVSGSPNQKNWAKEVEAILRSLGVPQLLNSAQSEGVVIAGSVNVIVGAIGLPTTSAQVSGYDFVDLQGGANVGPPPTVNGETFVATPGFNALAAICVATIDLDTSGTTLADVWALIMITGTTPLLLTKLTII